MLFALAAWNATGRPPPAREGGDGATVRLLGGFFALVIFAVLTLEGMWRFSIVGHVLATLAVGALVARLTLSEREHRQMLRTREEARTDDLTGLANRRDLYERLERALNRDRQFALVMIDLDRFVELADTLGRHAGEELVRQVAVRLCEASPPERLFAHIGNDEFLVVLDGVHDDATAAAEARALSRALDEPFTLDGLLVTVKASIGVALAPAHGGTREALLRCADVAMCRARARHSGVETYSEVADHRTFDSVRFVSELRAALEEEQLVLLARGRRARPRRRQPLAVQPHGHATAVRHPVAARSPLHAARAPRTRDHRGNRHARPKRALDVMARIGELGVEFSLDDFGTGYSSLAQLKRLPVRTLKIDKSFILDIADDRENASIVRSIVALAHSLNLRVVAEGVETPEHVAALARYRCDIVQGLYFGRPLPADELIAWLDGNGACAGALS